MTNKFHLCFQCLQFSAISPFRFSVSNGFRLSMLNLYLPLLVPCNKSEKGRHKAYVSKAAMFIFPMLYNANTVNTTKRDWKLYLKTTQHNITQYRYYTPLPSKNKWINTKKIEIYLRGRWLTKTELFPNYHLWGKQNKIFYFIKNMSPI